MNISPIRFFYVFVATATLFSLGLECGSTVAQQHSSSKQKLTFENSPIEIGLVDWNRDFDAACAAARQNNKPILLLFQEIPGCQGCQDYGSEVLSHPLIVESAENVFIPVLVYNNRKGVDETLLKKFNEPSWNYPVVRYLSAEGKDIIARKEKIYSVPETASRMVSALKKIEQPVPTYLNLLATTESKLSKATFAMHCYWEGEAMLGSIDGVQSTHSAWLDGREVVEVEFDSARISYPKLVAKAKSMECASNVYTHTAEHQKLAKKLVGDVAKPTSSVKGYRAAKASDQKYYLQNSLARFLPLTQVQTVKVNGALGSDQSIEKWLSPRQIAILKSLESLTPEQREGLTDLVVPSNELELAEYQSQLISRLKELTGK